MSEFKIITDSGCDLPQEMLSSLDVLTVPLIVNFRGEDREDSVDAGIKEMYDGLRAGEPATTSAVNPDRWMEKMESVVSVLPEKGDIRKEHPATFPINLPSEYIQALTDEGDIVIEPFGGSGTTLIACEQLNRKCHIMELELKYVDVIINRWETFTGKKAVKL
jgi:DNA modification methylase